jgi:uncharacterized protein YcfJ
MKRLEIIEKQQNFGLIGALVGGFLGKKLLGKKVGSVAGALIGGTAGHYGQRLLDKATEKNEY